MSLEIQPPHLADIAQTGFSMASLSHLAAVGRSGTLEPQIIGGCDAFYSERLLAEAKQKGTPWHIWLLQMTIAGLGASPDYVRVP